MTIHPFPSRRAAVSWQGRLDLASTEAEVVEVAREFLALFTPYEYARLPQACRPRKIVDGGDIASYALALMRHHCEDLDGNTRLVHRLAAFFAHASIRLSQLAVHVREPSREAPRRSA